MEEIIFKKISRLPDKLYLDGTVLFLINRLGQFYHDAFTPGQLRHNEICGI